MTVSQRPLAAEAPLVQELIQQQRVYVLDSLQRYRLSGCDPGTGRLFIHDTSLIYNKTDRTLDQER